MADTYCKVESCGYCHYNAEAEVYECSLYGVETSEYEECLKGERNESV